MPEHEEPPLVKGGQGRSASSLSASARFLAWTFLIVLAILLLAAFLP